MHNDILKNLPCFIQTAQLGSFSASARAMNLTPAAISKNISLLEASLGVRLFNRTTRSLSLTAEGEALFLQAEQAIGGLTAAIEQLKPKANALTGSVKISVANTIGRNLLLPMLADFYQRYPNIQLFLDFDDHVVDLVKGGYDLAIRGGTIHDSSLIFRPLMPLKVYLTASPEYLTQYGEPQNVAELAQHRHLVRRFADGKIMPWRFHRDDGGVDIYQPGNAVLTLSDPEGILQAALHHLGIGEVPNYLVKPHLEAGRLAVVLPEIHDAGSYQLAMLYPHKSLLAPRMLAVIEFLMGKFTYIKKRRAAARR